MPSVVLTRVSIVCCALSASACADILGLGDFTFGDGGNTSTSTGGNGDGGNGAGVSDGGTGGTPVVVGGMGGTGGDGGSGGGPGICDDPVMYANVVACDLPVLYLRFEDDGDAVMTNDSPVGTVPNGSYGGSAGFTEGVASIGGAALEQGPGRSEVLDPGAVLDFAPLEAYSLEVWVRAPASSTDTFAFIGTWNGGDQGHSLFVFPQSEPSGTPQEIEYKRNAAPDVFLCAETNKCSLMVDTFQHIVATFDPEREGIVTLYLDGARIGTKSLSNGLAVPPNAFAISGPGSEYVAFDELAIYDYVLTEDQVAAHFTCGIGGGC